MSLQRQANIARLCDAFGPEESRKGSSGRSTRLSQFLFLAHSTSVAKFSAICGRGYLESAERISAEGGSPPGSTEIALGTTGSVFFYVSPFRYPHTSCGLLFASSLERENQDDGIATPFDSGGLLARFTRPNMSETAVEFLRRHELPIPLHRKYLVLTMNYLFVEPEDYVNGTDPQWPDPIGLSGGDRRRWTHEVRIPDRVFVRGPHLQAVFALRNKIAADRRIQSLFKWCAAENVDAMELDASAGEEFQELERVCIAYIKRQLY